MARAELTAVVRPKCQKIADQLGFELVDVCLDRENTGKYLRIYIDRPEGMTIRVAVDMSGVEEVDLSDTSDLKEGETLE